MPSMRAIEIRPVGWAGLCLLIVSVLAFNLEADDAAKGSTFDNIDIVDEALVGKVAVLRVGSEVGENKLLSVFAGLKNKTAHGLNLEVQTIYKDEFGNALNSGSWIPFTLKAHEEKEYHSASISMQAVDFIVRVRRTAATDPAH